MKKLFYSAILISSIAAAQEKEPIETDRPDQSESASLVPKSMVQVETGASYEQVTDQSHSLLVPSILFRYGLNDNFELRLLTEIASDKEMGETQTGLNPVVIGLKAKLADEKGIVPKMAVIAQLQLPDLASPEFKADHLAPELRLSMEHSLSEKFSLAYNLGAEWDGDNAEATYLYTLTAGIDLSKKIHVFGEVYGFMPEDDKSDHRADAGATYLLSDNFMVDVSAGTGLSRTAPDYFVAAGFSFRL